MPDDNYDSEAEHEELKTAGKISIVVTWQEKPTTFLVKPNTVFQRIFDAWANQNKTAEGAVVFLYADKRVHGDESPKMREWEIGREYRLEAMVHQEGGC